MSEKRTVEGRVCRFCGRFLPITYFPLKAGKTYNRYKVCRDCRKLGHSCLRKEKEPKLERRTYATEEERQAAHKEYQRAWREKNADKVREARRSWYYKKKGEAVPATRVCRCCGRELPVDEFTDKNGRRTHTSKCRECRESGARAPRVGNGKGDRHEYHAKRYQEKKLELKVRNIERQTGRPINEPIKRKPKPVKQERLCETCRNWPCFDGIENLETDFAREGCHAFRKRGEAS